MNCTILPTTIGHVDDFWRVLDSVARERLYLAFLEGPPLEKLHNFVQENIKNGSPQFLAFVNDTVVGWCDIMRIDRP